MKLINFLHEMLPEKIPATDNNEPTIPRENFITDVLDGIALAPMSIRLTPHILASIDVGDSLLPAGF